MTLKGASLTIPVVALVVVLAGTAWLWWENAKEPSGPEQGRAGLAPPEPASKADRGEHGTVPGSITDPDEVREGGIRPTPLPLDAAVPRTTFTWPNVRVDHAVYVPEETGVTISRTNPNLIVAVAQGNGCYYFRSTDGGFNWTEGLITDPYDLGDPTIVSDNAGRMYYAYIGTFQHSGIFVTRSLDGGSTWLPGVPIVEHNAGAPFEDKEFPVCDRTSGPFGGGLYIGWTQFDEYASPDPADSTRIFFSYSRNQGASFAAPIRVSDHGGDCLDYDDTVEGAVPAVGPDGTVYLAWAGPRGMEFDRSTNGGLTWGTDRVISDIPGGWDFGVPGIYRCNGLPETMADISNGPYSGRVYVLWSDQRNGDTDVFLIYSDDRGAHWSPRVRVNGDPIGNGRHQFFPWADVDPVTGRIYVVFYDRRATTGNATEVWLATSSDGGASFAEEVISQSPFTPNPAVFFGDYIGISALDGRVRPFWMRLDGSQMSAWTALIELNPADVCDPAGLRLTVLPNPTRTEARIFACGPGAAPGKPTGPMQVFTADGRLVRSFAASTQPASGPLTAWDLQDAAGRLVPSGVYLLRLPGGATTRVVVAR